jgi:hypothetical protein
MPISVTYRNSVVDVRDDPSESPLYEPNNDVSGDGTTNYGFAGGDQSLAGNTYWEVVWNKPSASTAWAWHFAGVVDISTFGYTATTVSCWAGYDAADGWGFRTDYSAGSYRVRGVHDGGYTGNLFTGVVDGDIFMFAHNATTNKLWIGRNGTWSGDPVAGTGEVWSNVSGTTLIPCLNTAAQAAFANTGSTLKSYSTNQQYSVSGFDPFVSPIYPAAATPTLTGTVPIVSVPIFAYPSTGTSTLTGQAPVADTFIEARPGVGSSALTGEAPTADLIFRDVVSPAAATPTLTGEVPRVLVPFTLSPGVGGLTLAGNAPTANTGFEVVPGEGAATLTGKAPTVSFTFRDIVSPASSALTATGSTPSINPIPAGNVATSGNAPQTTVQADFYPATATPTFTGAAPVVYNASPFSLDAELQGLVGEATADFGNVFAGDGELAALEGDLLPGWQGDLALEAVAGEGTYSISYLFAGLGVLPAIQFSGSLDGLIQFAADIELGAVDAGSSTMFVGLSLAADASLASVEVDATWTVTLNFAADASIPAVALDSAVLLTGSLMQGAALALPAIESGAGFSDATTLTYQGLSTNAFVLAHSTYVNTQFDGLGRLGTNTYAAMSDGLYRLDGEDDAGVPIEAYFLTGYEDFGNEATKTQRVAYLGCASDGPLELLVRVDKRGDDLHSYSVERPHEEAQSEAPLRVKLGRGLKGRYWQVGLRNCDGADFHIDRLGLGVTTSTRKR